MELKIFSNHEELSATAATLLTHVVRENPLAKICIATGSTPTQSYELWVKKMLTENIPTNRLTIIKLDEWGGLPMDHPSTCETYIREHIIKPLKLREDQFISFQSQPTDPQAECARVAKEIIRVGGIDLCVLGIGKNGHLGFNEPAELWSVGPHVVQLSVSSLSHSMLDGDNSLVQFGITLGIKNIRDARKVLVLASGEEKAAVIRTSFNGPVTPACPASILQELPQASIFLDVEASQKLNQ